MANWMGLSDAQMRALYRMHAQQVLMMANPRIFTVKWVLIGESRWMWMARLKAWWYLQWHPLAQVVVIKGNRLPLPEMRLLNG